MFIPVVFLPRRLADMGTKNVEHGLTQLRGILC